MAIKKSGNQESTEFFGRIAWMEVDGFKSHIKGTRARSARIEFPGLTILCGANNSGKSSAIQPLLLIKQTIEALPIDQGPLRLSGDSVGFTNPAQFMSDVPFVVRLGLENSTSDEVALRFSRNDLQIQLDSTTYRRGKAKVTLVEGKALPKESRLEAAGLPIPLSGKSVRLGCFVIPEQYLARPVLDSSIFHILVRGIHLLHVSAERGAPLREHPYRRGMFELNGRFDLAMPGVLADWSARSDPGLGSVSAGMKRLGLAASVSAKRVNAVAVELKVGRLLGSKKPADMELVSLADVGFGVSQALPVVVALVAAGPGQIVYIEEPEIHLHPRAQKAMADLIAEAVNRGVRLIIETHSEILLTRLQTLIARGTLDHKKVVAHWFTQDPKTGYSKVDTTHPGRDGSLGEWPVDFADVTSEVDAEYADAAFEASERKP